ncbi:MAG: twin-arginine translocase TatA/TatE family subunit [Planctomycetota bacterium]|nr:twin-arginine translocase TatA/TatE family subunit [Planctomycetota bacterium]
MFRYLPSIGTTELLIILIVALLLLGSNKLPPLMRKLGERAERFRK